jgi:paraquat-inducible protein A
MPVVACHDCDLLNQLPDGVAATLLCPRCGAVLHRHRPDSIDRSLALTLGALTLFVVALSFPFLAMKSGGFFQETKLLTGIVELWRQKLYGLATLVLLTCVLIPLGQIGGFLYLLVPLKLNRSVPPHAIRVLRLTKHVAPWGMLEIFMLGILVALVKLGKMATIVPGISVFAFGLLVLVMAAAVNALDLPLLWERLGRRQ